VTRVVRLAAAVVGLLVVAMAVSQPQARTTDVPGSTVPTPAAAGIPCAKEDRSRPATKQPVTVDSDTLERFGKESLAIFSGSVVARQNTSVQYAERMEVYLDEKGDHILRTVSTGNVRIITRDCRTGSARRAEYHELDQRVVLSGHARVWDEDNVVSGESVVIYLAEDRSVVQGGSQERVKAIFYPRDDRTPPVAGLVAAAVGVGQSQPRTPGAPALAAPTPVDKGTPPAKDDRNQPVTVDSDKMERFGKESLVIFTGNVVARQNNSVQYADRLEVYLDEKGDRILRTVSTGNVRIITRDCRTGTARRAEYFELDQRVVLSGNARVWQEDNVVSGESVVIYLSQDRSVVQGGGQERVKAIFYPRDDKKDGAKDATAVAKKPPAQCAN
jgi:lipopolysaccharide export system protein LptA